MPDEDERLLRAITRPTVLLRPRTLRFLGRTAMDAARPRSSPESASTVAGCTS